MVKKSEIGCPNHEYWKEQRDWCLSSSHRKNWDEFVNNIKVCFNEDGVYRFSRLVSDWYNHIGWGLKEADSLELMQSLFPDIPIGVYGTMGTPHWFCNMNDPESVVVDKIDNQQTDNMQIEI